ncbi:MAG: hypothetical protein V2I82_03710 [Halieaceae bacterium]|nr:hypothetical protein [Halieaceae bacterium]
MSNVQNLRFLALLQREFREYRTSLLWTPLVTALLLALLMLGSVILANRISIIGDTVLDALLAGGSGVNVTISVNDDGEEVGRAVAASPAPGADGVLPLPPGSPMPPDYRVIDEGPASAEQWNFSKEWSFNPDPGGDDDRDDEDDDELSGRELNVMLGILHGIMLLVLFVTTLNYLLGALFDDRKDRSILFWRSMPVSEWENVAAKLVTALLLAPLIYIAISIVLQLVYVLLMMALVYRMDQDPFAVVVGNIDFVGVLLNPLSGWMMTALLIAPTYAWLSLASAFAQRSPFWLALVPPAGLMLAESLFIGTEFVENAVARHVPHVSDQSAMGFYILGPDWTSVDLLSMASGLVFAAACGALTVWLRTHRWELNR